MNFILDNLIAAGTARPMLVVMDQGYATRPGTPAPPRSGGLPFFGPGSPFEEVVLTDLVPMIDAGFRTLARRDQRAIAGLSMGGAQALQIGLTHPGSFAYVGAFSGAGVGRTDPGQAYGGAFADPAAFNARVRLLYLSAGTEEPQFHEGARTFHESLDRMGVRNVFAESEGTAHEWQTWRRALRDFAPRLFQPPATRSGGTPANR